MTEEEKNEVKKEEDKGVEVKKTLDVNLEHPDLKPENEGTTWLDWGIRIGLDAGGIATSRSKYGKGAGVDDVPELKASVEAPKKQGVWGKTKKALSTANETIDDIGQGFTDLLDEAVNNNEAMRDVNVDLDNVRDKVGEKAKKAGEFVVEKTKGFVEKFKIRKTSKGTIIIKDAIPLAKSGTKVASTVDNAASLATKGSNKAISLTDDAAKVATSVGDDAAKLAASVGDDAAKLAIKNSKFLKFISKKAPFASAYFAYDNASDRFDEDETREGIQEIASGIAGCVPGVGSLVSIVYDVDLLVYDEWGFHPMDYCSFDPMNPYFTKNKADQFWELIKTGDCSDMEYVRKCIDNNDWFPKMSAQQYAINKEIEKTKKKRLEQAQKEAEEKAYAEAEAKREKEIIGVVKKSKSDLVKLKQESKKLADNVDLSAEELQDLDLQYREASLMVTLQENALAAFYYKKNWSILNPGKKEFITNVSPLYDNSGMNGEVNNYKNAELNIDYQDGETMALSTRVDGKLHGTVFCLDSNKEIVGMKMYNHGEEVNLEGKKVEVYNRNHMIYGRYMGVVIDGEKFGWELTSDVNGCAKIAFYDEGANGYVNVENIGFHKYSEFDMMVKGVDDLFNDLKNQKAEEQHLTGPYALAQAKCDLSLHNAEKKDSCVEKLTPKVEEERNTIVHVDPINVLASKER